MLFGQRCARPAVARDKLPELRDCAGNHSAKSLAFILGSEFGSLRNCSYVSSSSLLNSGRARSSLRSRSHSASPTNSGNSAGMRRNNLSRSDEGNVQIASSISRPCSSMPTIQRATAQVKEIGMPFTSHHSAVRFLSAIRNPQSAIPRPLNSQQSTARLPFLLLNSFLLPFSLLRFSFWRLKQKSRRGIRAPRRLRQSAIAKSLIPSRGNRASADLSPPSW